MPVGWGGRGGACHGPCLQASPIRASATLKRRSAARKPSRKWPRRAALPSRTSIGTLGSHDVVAVCEAPDDESATALSLSVGSRGNVRSETLRAFSFEEMKHILTKVV